MPLQPLHGLYFEQFAIGDAARSPTRTITEADIVAFSGISGDYNEIHSSAEYSKSQHFGQRIAHGMLGLSLATGLAFQMGFMLGTVEVFRSLEWEFTGPIFIGDTIHISVEITETKAFPRLKNGRVTFKVSVLKQDGAVAQRGTWSILVKMTPAAVNGS